MGVEEGVGGGGVVGGRARRCLFFVGVFGV